MNPFAPNQRAAKLAQMLPTWASRAACAELAPNQAPFGPFFDDEVAQRPDPDTYKWPANVTKALRLCAGCPVRRECLDYVFESEKREATEWWKGELVPQNRRFGVFGGIPGRIREFYREPQGCEAWFKRWCEANDITLDVRPRMTA